MSEEFPIGTKVMTFDGSHLMKVMGKYGVVAKYDKISKKYSLRPARELLGHPFSVDRMEFQLADENFPTNATAKLVLEKVGVGGSRKNRRATKKGRKNRGPFSRRKKNL